MGLGPSVSPDSQLAPAAGPDRGEGGRTGLSYTTDRGTFAVELLLAKVSIKDGSVPLGHSGVQTMQRLLLPVGRGPWRPPDVDRAERSQAGPVARGTARAPAH